jgi:hypothetical protein
VMARVPQKAVTLDITTLESPIVGMDFREPSARLSRGNVGVVLPW